MYEEQWLVARGYPLEDALTLCHSLRREGALEEFMKEEKARLKEENERVCTV